jgi:hypothetical protein
MICGKTEKQKKWNAEYVNGCINANIPASHTSLGIAQWRVKGACRRRISNCRRGGAGARRLAWRDGHVIT